MGLDKIIKNLQKIMDTKKSRESKRIEALQDLLERLERKLVKFLKKLDESNGNKEKAKLERRIKVCKAQLKKGRAALQDLQDMQEKESSNQD